MEIDKFLLELENLIIHEANNGDYYLDGYVDASNLQELINKHFPEREFVSYNNYCHWYPRDPNAKRNPLIPAIYNDVIKQQLEADVNLLKLFNKESE